MRAALSEPPANALGRPGACSAWQCPHHLIAALPDPTGPQTSRTQMPDLFTSAVRSIAEALRRRGLDEAAASAAADEVAVNLRAAGLLARPSHYEDVVAFHRCFGVPVGPTPAAALSPERYELRRRLMREEFEELLEAMELEDPAQIAKESVDLAVTVLGTSAEYGLPFDEVWAEVHRSNMAKLGADGHPILREDGKVLKPEGWCPPDIASVLAGSGGGR